MKSNRGYGTINKIKSMLESIYFGKYHFEVGKILIDSMVLGSILSNIEVAYNLSKTDITILEKCHEAALRMLLSLPDKTPKQMLYLLTGSIPITFKIKQRRLIYLHHILNCDDESLLKTFFLRQYETRKNNDWATQVVNDMKSYDVNLTMEEIKKTLH